MEGEILSRMICCIPFYVIFVCTIWWAEEASGIRKPLFWSEKLNSCVSFGF